MSIIFDLSAHVATPMISFGTPAVNGQDHAIKRDFKLMNVTESMVGRITKSPWLLFYTRSDTDNQITKPTATPQQRKGKRV